MWFIWFNEHNSELHIHFCQDYLQDCSFSHCISKDDVIRAVKHLNPEKSGGVSGVMSDSVIHGTNMLFEYITCLFNSTQGTVAITEQLH